MALGKDNKRIRPHMGDNGWLKFGNPAAWSQFGKSNKWSLNYDFGGKEAIMADDTVVNMQSTRKASLKIELAQTHPEEMALIDDLINSETKIEFWGDGGKIGTENIQVYIPELIITGSTVLETPAGANMSIALEMKINPQDAVFDFQDVDLPSDASPDQGGDPVTSKNEFFAYYVAIPD